MPELQTLLTRKIGPLPAVAWLGVVGGGVYFARKLGQAENAEEVVEEGEGQDFATGVDFPTGQLRPVVGEHGAEIPIGPITIPAPQGGGIVIPYPGADPIVFPKDPAPLPDPTKQPPPPSIPSFRWMGRTWNARQRSAFDKFIRSRRPAGYRSLREWIHGVNIAGGVQRKPRTFKRGHHRGLAQKMGWI